MYIFWHVVYWPYQASPTPSGIYLSPPWAVGDNTSCNTSFTCGLLILSSLTHTLKDLPSPPPPPHGLEGMACRIVPLLHVVFWPYRQRPHPHTQGFTRVIQSVSLQSDFLSPRHGNHQHHSTRAKPYQKPRSSMHSKYIVYFQVVS